MTDWKTLFNRHHDDEKTEARGTDAELVEGCQLIIAYYHKHHRVPVVALDSLLARYDGDIRRILKIDEILLKAGIDADKVLGIASRADDDDDEPEKGDPAVLDLPCPMFQ